MSPMTTGKVARHFLLVTNLPSGRLSACALGKGGNGHETHLLLMFTAPPQKVLRREWGGALGEGPRIGWGRLIPMLLMSAAFVDGVKIGGGKTENVCNNFDLWHSVVRFGATERLF